MQQHVIAAVIQHVIATVISCSYNTQDLPKISNHHHIKNFSFDIIGIKVPECKRSVNKDFLTNEEC